MTPEGTGVGTVDLDFAVRGYVRDALETVRMGDTFWFSVTATVFPGRPASVPMNVVTVLPEHPVPVPGFIVTLYFRNPVMIGEYLNAGAVQTGFPTREMITRLVRALVDSLRETASRHLRIPG